MIAADDLPLRAAQGARERDVRGGIEFEAIGLFRHIRHWMKRRDSNLTAVPHPFDEAAAFVRQGAARLDEDLFALPGRNDEARRLHFDGAMMRPTTRPLPPSTMSISSPLAVFTRSTTRPPSTFSSSILAPAGS